MNRSPTQFVSSRFTTNAKYESAATILTTSKWIQGLKIPLITAIPRVIPYQSPMMVKICSYS